MTGSNDVLDRLRRANLVPDTATLDREELGAVVSECELRVDLERGTAAAGGTVAAELVRRPIPGPRSRRPMVVFSLAFAFALIVVGVVAFLSGSGAGNPEADDAADRMAATPTPATTTTPETTTTLLPTSRNGVTFVDNIDYYADAERTLDTSVYFPAEGDGPWPVVIVYSDFSLRARDRILAQQIAERGAVVFAPIWVDAYPPALTLSEYLTGEMWDRAACAVGFAQAQAEAFGGDPTRTTLVGDSGGEHPAAWVALGLADTANCAEPIRYRPTGLVAGESQWLFQEAKFDKAFAAEDGIAVGTVDQFFNPERWTPAEDLSVFLWATPLTSNSNELEDPPAADSWIWSRDPGGAIVEDLAAVGAFDDGLITLRDNSRLMRLRMAEAGIAVDYYESDDSRYDLDDAALDTIWPLISGE